jgi:AmmeMemoRadiSam system protein B
MPTSRPPAVAGAFYPDNPAELAAAVDGYMDEAGAAEPGPAPKALIVPHAGYVYSGPIAGSAYCRVRELRGRIERVVLAGPAHRVRVRSVAASSADAFRTPLGDVPVDREAIAELLKLSQVELLDRAHAPEHCLEVQLPFLQRALETFSLVPLLVGDATFEEVAEVLEALWGGSETLILISSDLSHYFDSETARRLDANTTRAIEGLEPRELGSESACGRVPIGGLLLAAERRGLHVRTLDLRNSGDTAGPRDQVVGYGAYSLA